MRPGNDVSRSPAPPHAVRQGVLSSKFSSILSRLSTQSSGFSRPNSTNSNDPNNRLSARTQEYRTTARLTAFPPNFGEDSDPSFPRDEKETMDKYMSVDTVQKNILFGLPPPAAKPSMDSSQLDDDDDLENTMSRANKSKSARPKGQMTEVTAKANGNISQNQPSSDDNTSNNTNRKRNRSFLVLGVLLLLVGAAIGGVFASRALAGTSDNTGEEQGSPTVGITAIPVVSPTSTPTENPTARPSTAPTSVPTQNPSKSPTRNPTTRSPTTSPTKSPTRTPTTKSPTRFPTPSPTTFENFARKLCDSANPPTGTRVGFCVDNKHFVGCTTSGVFLAPSPGPIIETCAPAPSASCLCTPFQILDDETPCTTTGRCDTFPVATNGPTNPS